MSGWANKRKFLHACVAELENCSKKIFPKAQTKRWTVVIKVVVEQACAELSGRNACITLVVADFQELNGNLEVLKVQDKVFDV